MGQNGVEARNRNYAQIVKQLKFSRRPWYNLTAWNDEMEERIQNRQESAYEAVSAMGDDSDSDGAATPDEHAAERELVQVGQSH